MQGGRRVIYVFALPVITLVILFIAALRAPARQSHSASGSDFFARVRYTFDARLQKHLSPPNAALASGILFGGTARFEQAWKNIFRATGTSHIVAVSGANLVYIMVWLEWGIRWLHLRRRMRFFFTAVILITYALLTGMSASVIRAALMAVYENAAPLVGRSASSLHGLAAAALVMVLVSPSVVYDIGFQFSCLATLGILLFTASARTSGLAQPLGATVAATLFVLPLQLYYFHTMSFAALIANVLVAPLIPIIMCVGAIHLLFAMPLTGILLTLPTTSALTILRWLADLPGSSGDLYISRAAVISIYVLLGMYACRAIARTRVIRV